MMDWISVDDRLPEIGSHVLSCCKRLDGCWEITRTQFLYNEYISSHFWNYFSSGCGCCDADMKNVTHWMPLPEPPKDE